MTQFTLVVNTTADQNDGSASNSLSLRDAIMIANSDPIANDYEIVLTSGATYQLTAINLTTDSDRGGDLDIYAKGEVTITTDGNQAATIDASRLATRDRVIEVGIREDSVTLATGNLKLDNIVITGGSDNSAFKGGGGIYIGSRSSVLLNSVVVTENFSSDSGGGLANVGTLLLLASVVKNNRVSGGSFGIGGGINNIGTLTILDSTIENNQSNNGGGGIGNFEVATIINSTIHNNSSRDGGGIYNNGGTLGLTNVTVSSNTSTFDYGGGLNNNNGSIATLTNSTITNNTATSQFSSNETSGGGIGNFNATLNLRNTIVAGNTAELGADIRSWFGSHIVNDDGSNLIDQLLFGDDTAIDNNIDPKLGPLQNNGGLTLTHALLEGSPAINAGNNANIAADSLDSDNDGDTTELILYDQRGSGYPRIYGNAVDIGAVEFQPPPPSISLSNVATTTDDLANSNAVFTVTLSYASGSPITVQYTTQDGSAIAGSDYIPTSGTLTFSPGQTALALAVPIITDTVFEGDELFFVTLSNPSNAAISNFIGTGIITNIDPAEYAASNPDLIAAFGYNLDALRNHYYSNGINEGRSTNSFDEYRYIASNTDLIPVFGLNTAAAIQHYLTNGYTEGRSTTSFDPARYLDSYDDLLSVYGTNTVGATQHYITNGYTEGRNPNLFNSDRYIASHGDLIQAFHYNLEAGSNHYLYSGRNEGRQVTFDPYSYLSFNSDVASAYNNDPILATKHYIESGYGEGRRVA
ncbi:Calx-beta domain-containing protein [Chroococcus sp. FPU101]|uniref:Calx-beta domain-containing protein n=1 Tax=Chroococcus sp. FPU101 TaxID=1974212 RepID=UPI001A8FA3B5|nr:choice-of-anchor Q domain-containing protein [Chroococcus sp. FPU101]GFE67466.1 hypothetical protein CFPU101_00760 [Chroococcus sp. FPU101]